MSWFALSTASTLLDEADMPARYRRTKARLSSESNIFNYAALVSKAGRANTIAMYF